MFDKYAAPAASAFKAVFGAIIRHLLTAVGTALVAHGWVNAQTVGTATGPIADYILGAMIACGSLGWGALKAWVTHQRWYVAYISPAQVPPAN